MFWLFGTTRVHDAESAEFAGDVARALEIAGVSQKDAAITMGISEKFLSNALAGRDHLSLWRLAKLPQSFQSALWTIRLRRVGHDVLAPGELQSLVDGVRALLGVHRRRVLRVAEEKARGAA